MPELEKQGHEDSEEPVEDQHEQVVSWPAVKYTFLQSDAVVVEIIEHDEKVESYGIIE